MTTHQHASRRRLPLPVLLRAAAAAAPPLPHGQGLLMCRRLQLLPTEQSLLLPTVRRRQQHLLRTVLQPPQPQSQQRQRHQRQQLIRAAPSQPQWQPPQVPQASLLLLLLPRLQQSQLCLLSPR